MIVKAAPKLYEFRGLSIVVLSTELRLRIVVKEKPRMSHQREIRMHLVSRAMKALQSLPTIDDMAAVLELIELVGYPAREVTKDAIVTAAKPQRDQRSESQ